MPRAPVNKPPLPKGRACKACRSRKVRCDGKSPCGACVRFARFENRELAPDCCVYNEKGVKRTRSRVPVLLKKKGEETAVVEAEVVAEESGNHGNTVAAAIEDMLPHPTSPPLIPLPALPSSSLALPPLSYPPPLPYQASFDASEWDYSLRAASDTASIAPSLVSHSPSSSYSQYSSPPSPNFSSSESSSLSTFFSPTVNYDEIPSLFEPMDFSSLGGGYENETPYYDFGNSKPLQPWTESYSSSANSKSDYLLSGWFVNGALMDMRGVF